MKATKSKRIVIAEDSLTQALRLIEILERARFEVFHARDGRQALTMVMDTKPVAVISDIIMPEMDGYALCRSIKEDDELYHIPVILLTSLSEPTDVIRGLECGTDSYIIKPYSESYLLSRLYHLLENKYLPEERVRHQGLNILFGGKEYLIHSDPIQILNLLISTYDAAIQKNLELAEQERELILLNQTLKQKVEERKRDLKVQLEEKIRAESLLRKSEEKYRELVSSAMISIYLSAVDGKLSYANEAFRDMLNYPSLEELHLENMLSFFKEVGQKNRFTDQLFKEGKVRDFETELLTRDRQTKYVILNAILEGETISGMIMDISDRKMAEQRMKSYQQELIKARHKAEQSEKLKTAFLANMSNEILTPMNSLAGFSELLSRPGLTTETLAGYAEKINTSSNQLINLIDNIIDIAKVECGEVTLKMSECRINHILLDLYAFYEQKLRETRKETITLLLKRGNKDNDFAILTEPYRLKQVLSNLLSNAIQYTDTGTIEFGYNIINGQDTGNIPMIRFFIKDTGKGIMKEKLSLIFDRFRQSEEYSTKLSDGAGLGLPVSKAYIELLGGRLWIESEIGAGSEFCFVLPYHQISMKEGIQIVNEVQELPADWHDKTILVAEDTDSNWLYLEAILKKTRVRLIRAENGQVALDKLRQHKEIDLILMDLRMPVMSGYDAVIQIKDQGLKIPIIVQTAYANEEDKEKIKKLECDDYLIKPVIKENLLKVVSRYISKNK